MMMTMKQRWMSVGTAFESNHSQIDETQLQGKHNILLHHDDDETCGKLPQK